jgi:hypothetical protein
MGMDANAHAVGAPAMYAEGVGHQMGTIWAQAEIRAHLAILANAHER